MNQPVRVQTRTVRRIVASYVFSYLNLIIFALAVIAVWFGALKNALFVVATIFNTAVGILQEIRVKNAIDRLTVVTECQSLVIREGEGHIVPLREIVLHDLLHLRLGDQIPADAEIVVCDNLTVNEALLTGESNNIAKQTGDDVLAGSFVTAGEGYARVTRVGEKTYASQTVSEARQPAKIISPLFAALNRVLKVISIMLIPLGAFLFLSDYRLSDINFIMATSTTIAGMVSLVPQGLLVLTNVSLAMGVIRMVKRMAFFKALPSVELLARLDEICFDKTGTLSDGTMRVSSVVGYMPDAEDGLRALMSATPPENATALAIKAYLQAEESSLPSYHRLLCRTAFSSERQWSGASFSGPDGGRDTWILGAPERLLPAGEALERAARETAAGIRVLALCKSGTFLQEHTGTVPPSDLTPAALVLLSHTIREGVAEAVEHLQAQGLTLKVISGDSVATTSAVAGACGIAQAYCAVDLSKNRPGYGGITYASLAEKYRVFGRATPYDKRELIRALQGIGKRVGMVGDGVNDVLGMKEATLSIAMGSGSEAAKNIAHVILLHSDFGCLQHILEEGRRVIGNIETVATLYLTKTVYSIIMLVMFLALPLPYPFMPIHATLISMATIGLPSIFLAFTRNDSVTSGHFVKDVIVKAIPAGLLVSANVLAVQWMGRYYALTRAEVSTLCVLVTAVVAIRVLISVLKPFRMRSLAIVCFVAIALILAFTFMQQLFSLKWEPGMPLLITLGCSILSSTLIRFIRYPSWLVRKRRARRSRARA